MARPLILITNDDGIDSPGLTAVVGVLDSLGELLIVAPRVQQTSMGRARSQQEDRDGRLFAREIIIGDKKWPAYAANATPALTVDHALQELATRRVDLAISGINYGENVGTCVTVSGTIGAALEAAEHHIPAIAASLELPSSDYQEYVPGIDFSAAAFFVRFFAERMLGKQLPQDVDLLKIDVPEAATEETPWAVTRQDRFAYYRPTMPERDPFDGAGKFKHLPQKGGFSAEGSDAHSLAQGIVSVTPMSLDMTSRTELDGVAEWLRE